MPYIEYQISQGAVINAVSGSMDGDQAIHALHTWAGHVIGAMCQRHLDRKSVEKLHPLPDAVITCPACLDFLATMKAVAHRYTESEAAHQKPAPLGSRGQAEAGA